MFIVTLSLGGVQSIAVSMSVCRLSICLLLCSRISKTNRENFSFLHVLRVAVARPSSNNAIRFVLSVLRLASCFHIMGQTQIQAIGKLFTVTCQVAPLNCIPKAKSTMLDCLPYMFSSCRLFFFFFFPRLISAVADWLSTILPHMVWP